MSTRTVMTHAYGQLERVSLFSLSVGDRAAVVWGDHVMPFVVTHRPKAGGTTVTVRFIGDRRTGDVVQIHAFETVVEFPPSEVRGVSLARGVQVTERPARLSPLREVDAGSVVAGGKWWGVPAYVVQDWITARLRKGQYDRASALSVLLHGRQEECAGFVETVQY